MKIISLFCGAGGMDIGFTEAGHKIIWANDNDKDSIQSYAEYFYKKYRMPKNHVVCKDIKSIPIEDIPDGDVVIGGFPCQGFSIANPYRKVKDERNTLYLELLRVIKGKNPKYFVAENVAGLCSIGGYENKEDKKNRLGRVLKAILKELGNSTKIGYHVEFKILTASEFGVPQNRRRVIILGTRKDISPILTHPKETHTLNLEKDPDLKKALTLGSAIKGIPTSLNSRHNFLNHEASKHKVKINGYIGNRKTDPNKPSPTIVGRGGKTGGPVIIPHPSGKRRMSVRELARIQCFPDDFEFKGSISSAYCQIGNAVPWKLAYHIAKQIPLK